MPICSVCNKNQTQRVCNSKLAPISNAYCDPCFTIGLEPWTDFVGVLFSMGAINENQVKASFSEKFLDKMTKYHSRTIAEALSEAKETQDTFDEYWANKQAEDRIQRK